MGIRDTMREAFVQAALQGEHATGWRLRIGSIEQLAEDTERVLGYQPKSMTTFLGLPIEVCPFGQPNELVTSRGAVVLAQTAWIKSPIPTTFSASHRLS
jgi:hypothetical protein